MDVKRIVPIAQQIFSALSALHVQDALHRDVKAANIMLTLDGNQEIAKLCDLGIVSVIGDPSLTGTSVFMGSKHSAPFEQMVGEELDPRTFLLVISRFSDEKLGVGRPETFLSAGPCVPTEKTSAGRGTRAVKAQM